MFIFLNPIIDKKEKVTVEYPYIDDKKCVSCGKCADICQFNALAKVKADLEALTDDADKFMSDNLTKFKQEVAVFKPENYGL